MVLLFITALAALWLAVWSIRPIPVHSYGPLQVRFLDLDWYRSRPVRTHDQIALQLAELRSRTLAMHDVAWHLALLSGTDVSRTLAPITARVLVFELGYWGVWFALHLSFPGRLIGAARTRLFVQSGAILARTLSPALTIPPAYLQ